MDRKKKKSSFQQKALICLQLLQWKITVAGRGTVNCSVRMCITVRKVKQASAGKDRACSAQTGMITAPVSRGPIWTMMTHGDDVEQPSNAARIRLCDGSDRREGCGPVVRGNDFPSVNWMWNNPVREKNSRAPGLRSLPSSPLYPSLAPSIPPSSPSLHPHCVCSICWCSLVSERGWGLF